MFLYIHILGIKNLTELYSILCIGKAILKKAFHKFSLTRTCLSSELRASLDDSVVNDASLHGVDEVDYGQCRLVCLVLEMLDL